VCSHGIWEERRGEELSTVTEQCLIYFAVRYAVGLVVGLVHSVDYVDSIYL
jgi:hypothetical protein